MRVFFTGHQEDGFDFRSQSPVRERHGEFRFDVGQGTQPAKHDAAATLLDEIHGQALKAFDLHIRVSGQ